MTEEAPPGVPRWLKVSLLVVAIGLAAVLVLSGALGIEHGPRLH